MDNPLQRRLLGVVVIMGALLALSLLLPTRHNEADAPAAVSGEGAVVSVQDASHFAAGGAQQAPAAAVPLPPLHEGNTAAPTTMPAAGASEPVGAQAGVTPPPSSAEDLSPSEDSTPVEAEPAPHHPATPAVAPSAAALAAARAEPPAPAKAETRSSAPAPVATPVAKAAPSPKAVAVPPKATPAPSPAATPAANGEVYWVQVGSYAAEGNAQTTVSLLHGAGYTAQTQPLQTAHGLLHRVRIGPFKTPASADDVLVKIQRQGYPQARRVSE